MKKKALLILIAILIVTSFAGCGRKKISNDLITINNYKNLKVEDSTDEEKVWQVLLANCTVEEYPQEELKARIEELETQYSYVAYYDGKEASELIEEKHGMTSEELAKQQLMKEYAIALIAEEENLNLTDEEYEEKLIKVAQENGFENPEEYESLFDEDELRASFLEERVLKLFIEGK